MEKLKGIDISKWQGTVDFAKVKADGIQFAILREGYSTSVDSKFYEYVQGCRNVGIPVLGVYHFSYALTVDQAREEAAFCIEQMKKAGLGTDVIVFFDFEYDTVTKAKNKGVILGSKECNAHTKAFCEYVTERGYKAGIYSNIDYYKNMYDKALINNYVFWLADYSGNPDYPCMFQQYTSSGKVNGINGNVDMDYCFMDEGGKNSMSKKESAMQWMEKIAKDDLHGYDQIYRWGEKGDYDCSAAVITAWEQAGVPVKTNGATYTGNILSVFKKLGFIDVIGSVNLATGEGLERCDVLLNSGHHVAMYCGNGKEVEASINENGTATGGKPGDQTGKEFLIRNYRNYPWDHVLRYPESGTAKKSVAEVAKEVLNGDWGNGAERKTALESAGYDYSEVQNAVNVLVNGKPVTPKKSIDELANEVIAGKWGSGDQRKQALTAAGYSYTDVQSRVNQLLKSSGTAKKSVDQVAREVISGKWGNGENRKKKLKAAGYDYNAVQKRVNELL